MNGPPSTSLSIIGRDATAPSLLTVRGRVVPYVTRWSAERLDERVTYLAGRLAYPDPSPADWSHGVVWVRDGVARGRGAPEWRGVHSGRQRLCMQRLLCQVCAKPAVIGGRISWLLADDESEHPDGLMWTSTPPTCRACIRTALVQCPVLRGAGAVVCTVGAAVPFAVTGDIHEPGRAGPVEAGVAVRLDWIGALRHVLAKQLAVRLLDLRREPLHPTEPVRLATTS